MFIDRANRAHAVGITKDILQMFIVNDLADDKPLRQLRANIETEFPSFSVIYWYLCFTARRFLEAQTRHRIKRAGASEEELQAQLQFLDISLVHAALEFYDEGMELLRNAAAKKEPAPAEHP